MVNDSFTRWTSAQIADTESVAREQPNTAGLDARSNTKGCAPRGVWMGMVRCRRAAGVPLKSLRRTRVGILAVVLLGLCAGGCSTAPQTPVAAATVHGPTVAFESIDGPPESIFRKLVQDLTDEAEARQMAVVSRDAPAQYRIRGYLAALVEKRRAYGHRLGVGRLRRRPAAGHAHHRRGAGEQRRPRHLGGRRRPGAAPDRARTASTGSSPSWRRPTCSRRAARTSVAPTWRPETTSRPIRPESPAFARPRVWPRRRHRTGPRGRRSRRCAALAFSDDGR